jgi:propionyl-CoA carboxylase alpha chain
VRNDAGVREGDEISMFYDPMISKLCLGPDAGRAVDGMAGRWRTRTFEGVGHNVPFLAAVMDQERFKSGQLSTSYIVDEFPDGFHGVPAGPLQKDVMVAAAVAMNEIITEQSGDPSQRTDWIVLIDREPIGVSVGYDDEEALTLDLIGEGRALQLSDIDWRPGLAQFRGVLASSDEEGAPFTAEVKRVADGFEIRSRASKSRVRVMSPHHAELFARLPEKVAADTSKLIQSPMPGLVVSIAVTPGQSVKTGETVAIIEAMKMQNIMKAERDGVVKSVGAKAGDPVAADDVLVEFE